MKAGTACSTSLRSLTHNCVNSTVPTTDYVSTYFEASLDNSGIKAYRGQVYGQDALAVEPSTICSLRNWEDVQMSQQGGLMLTVVEASLRPDRS